MGKLDDLQIPRWQSSPVAFPRGNDGANRGSTKQGKTLALKLLIMPSSVLEII
jgi:hypothetical protein